MANELGGVDIFIPNVSAGGGMGTVKRTGGKILKSIFWVLYAVSKPLFRIWNRVRVDQLL